MRVRGVVLSYSDTQNGTFTPITDLISLDKPPSYELSTFDNTTQDSAGDARIKGIGESVYGSSTGKYLHVASVFSAIDALLGVSKWWKLQYPKNTGQSTAGDSYKCQGVLVLNDPPAVEMSQNARAESTVKIEWTDKRVFTAGS